METRRRGGFRFQPDLRFRKRVRIVAVAAGLAAMLAMAPVSVESTAPRLRHLNGVDELKTWFNAGKGHPRLIFLLSPT